MASLFSLPRPLPRFRGGWAVGALMLILALRLLPAEAIQALDRGATGQAPAPTAAQANPSEQAGETFPGSAYFFAQDAFAPLMPDRSVEGVTSLPEEGNSPHVLQIERGPAALSMALRGVTPLDDARALQCMTNAIYYEAGNEPEEGQRAVAQVILNRLASGQWPASVCGVIYQGGERSDRRCQFTFSCDGSMARLPAPTAWTRARRVAARALSGEIFAPAGLATFYHTLAVRPPWAERVRPVAVIGAHIFYRLPGQAGAPATYRMRYAGREYAQPGPYAFSAPQSPLPAPPGPDMLAGAMMPGGWTVPGMAPSPLLPVASMATGTTAAPPFSAPVSGFSGQPTEAPSPPRDPGLPQSTIRAEYRNSGRPLP